MSLFDEIRLYLPKYLSVESQQSLFADLDMFPDNIGGRLYSGLLADDPDVFQGDGLESLLIADLPAGRVIEGPVMVLTNTCDTSSENRRHFAPRIAYCPIIKLSKYVDFLRENGLMVEEALTTHIETIKRQEISSLFYLPSNARLNEDCIALLDSPSNCEMSYLQANPEKKRKLFILSNYGFYLFLFKLSIHFTRVREAIDRG